MILLKKDKFKNVSRTELRAEVDALLAQAKAAVAKRRPVAKKLPVAAKPKAAPMPKPAKPAAPKPAAPAPKPASRSARLRQHESEVAASKPRDKRLVWRGMSTK